MNRQKSAREYDTDKSKAETNLSLFRYIVQVNSNMSVCRQYWECSGANTTSEPSEEVCGLWCKTGQLKRQIKGQIMNCP